MRCELGRSDGPGRRRRRNGQHSRRPASGRSILLGRPAGRTSGGDGATTSTQLAGGPWPRTRTTAAGVSPCVVNVNRQVGWC